MNEENLRHLVSEILAGIAPEADLTGISASADLRLALDLDSMDFLNLVVGLHEHTGLDIPEADYPRLFTLAGMQAYFARLP